MRWLARLLGKKPRAIPAAMWEDCVSRLPFLQDLPPDDLARLKLLAERLLDAKSFTGAGGLELSDDIAVAIAAQACLLVLNLTLDLYDDMAGVIVYPSAFIVPFTEVDEAGVVHEWREPLSGEAMHAGGAVVLSWEDALDAAPGAAYNVVIHEFAHKIDMDRGAATGGPPLLAAFHGGIDGRAWKEAFSEAYDDFCDRVDEFDARLPRNYDPEIAAHAALYDALTADLPLDPYAAHHPAEFFAVASEAFFVRPQPLAEQYPRIYALLSKYYRQDPLAREKAAGRN